MRFEWLSGGEAGSPELIHQEGGSGDTIALVFTGAELADFASDPALHGNLADWLPWAPAAEAQPSDIAYLDLAEHPALVIYGAPPSIDVTPANDDAGHALAGSDPGQFLYGTPEGAIPAYQDTGFPFMLGSDHDNLLESLSDEGLHDVGAADALEALAGLAPDTGAEANTFLLTHIDIADLIGDYDQAQDPGLPGWEAELLDRYIAGGELAPDPVPGTITIEIEDGSVTAATHILG